jgi:hypothetical protein
MTDIREMTDVRELDPVEMTEVMGGADGFCGNGVPVNPGIPLPQAPPSLWYYF